MSLTEAQRAIVSLQSRALRASDGYAIDVLDRALDEIVRNYSNPHPAPWQVRSALANGAKVVQFRRETVGTTSLDEADRGAIHGTVDDEFAVVDFRDWLDRSVAVNSDQRQLLVALADGDDAEQLAQDRGVPVTRIRERISRARARARAAYAVEEAA